MSYNVVLTRSFKHSIKQLEKRFCHVKDDVRVAIQVLLQTPRLGACRRRLRKSPSNSSLQGFQSISGSWCTKSSQIKTSEVWEHALSDRLLGVVIPGGSGVRKLRVRNSDLGKGKSGGYRLLYYVEDHPIPTIYLLFLYAKSDREDVTRRELKQLLEELADGDQYHG